MQSFHPGALNILLHYHLRLVPAVMHYWHPRWLLSGLGLLYSGEIKTAVLVCISGFHWAGSLRYC